MDEIVKFVRKLDGKSVLILTHHNADIDAAASAIGLSMIFEQLGIKSSIGVSESVSKAAKNISKDRKILIDPDCGKFDSVIVVDTSVPEQVSRITNLKVDAIIDHHIPGKLADEAKAKWIAPESKSTAQMIYKLAKSLKCKISKEFAMIIAAGIVADTAHLKIADIDVFETLTELLKTGISFENVLSSIETPMDQSEIIAALKAAQRSEIYKIGDLIVCTSKISSHEAPAARALMKMGADIAIVATIRDDEIRISSRGRDRILKYGIDLSEIFKDIGAAVGGSGGGHNMAGSANGKDSKSANKAFKIILDKISEKVGGQAKSLN